MGCTPQAPVSFAAAAAAAAAAACVVDVDYVVQCSAHLADGALEMSPRARANLTKVRPLLSAMLALEWLIQHCPTKKPA